MCNLKIDPTTWTTDFLMDKGEELIHRLALSAHGALITYKLVLGRCLLAGHQIDLHRRFGCNSIIHYAVQHLGVSRKEAQGVYRVARTLEQLPLLTRAAETAAINWCKLREVVSKATPETERFWLEICKRYSVRQVSALVLKTPAGGLPGDPGPEARQATVHDLRIQLEPEAKAVVERALAVLAQREGRVIHLAEALEWLCADLLSGAELMELKESRGKQENKLVNEARNLAKENGPTWDGLVAVEEETVDSMRLAKKAEPHWANPRRRQVTPAERRHLLRRDGYRCQTPGCGNHLWLEVHHIEFYCEGGLTLPPNLVMLCSGCHANVHRGHLRISGTVDQGLVFRDAQGRRLDRDQEFATAQWLDFWFGWTERSWTEQLLAHTEIGQPPGGGRRLEQFLKGAMGSIREKQPVHKSGK